MQQELIRLAAVMAICGLSRSKIYALISEGKFPRQVKLSARSAAWVKSEIYAWNAEKIAKRDEVA